jgi:U4/U6.U5 tri-snRNP component SNU23
MSKSKGVYDNATGGDTSFRRTWDREEMAQRHHERMAREAKERKERAEARAAGKKYIPHKDEDEKNGKSFDEAKMVEARRERIQLDDKLNKVQIVPAGSTGGRRGKGPGYYCEACDLNFTNSLEYVEHLNSKQHMHATGQTGVVEKATLEMVKERLAWLKQKKYQRLKEEEFDLNKRLREREKVEEQERIEKKERKRVKREEAKRKKETMAEATTENEGAIDDDAVAMARMMGFGGFGSTKVS